MKNLHLPRYSRLGLSVILGLVLSLVALTTIHAQQPGDLDITFNPPHGVITTPIGIDTDWAHDVAIQPDGKIVVAGESATDIDSDYVFAVARYSVTGTLDATFGDADTGIVTTPVGIDASAGSVAIQPDGKIVVAGQSGVDVDHQDFTVARYTLTGTLDSDFNQTGIVTTSIDAYDSIGSIAIQPDGKIVATGSSGADSDQGDFAVARYTITGSLDSTFSDPDGVVTTPIDNATSFGSSVALQPDGKIVVVGLSNYDPISDTGNFGVVRYTISGVLDSDFGKTGIVTTPLSNGLDYASDIALQRDGKIVVVGFSDSSDFAVVRYTITGALDSTFGTTGIVTTSFDVVQQAYDVAIQPNGKIVVVGTSGYFYTTVARYLSDGNLDTTFHQTGIVTTPVNLDSGGSAVALQPDGKIVVVGASSDLFSPFDFSVVRYWGDRYAYLPVILKN